MEYPELLNAADYLVDKHVRRGRGGNVAVQCEDRSLTYADIQAGMNRFGNALLSALGFRMEERVAMLMLDTEMFPQVLLGAIKIGAVPICLNTLMRPRDYLYFLNDSRTRTICLSAAPGVQGVPPARPAFWGEPVSAYVKVRRKRNKNDGKAHCRGKEQFRAHRCA